MPSTSGMKGGGFYDAHSSGQRASIEALLPWIDAAADATCLPPHGKPLVLVDYGCSEGRNAIASMSCAIEALRHRDTDVAVSPVFADLPSNNFNQLFHNLDAAGWLGRGTEGLCPVAAAGSFYQRLLPAATVHLALSFNSVLWLDQLPSEPLREFIVYLGPRLYRPDVHVPAATGEAFRRRAEQDLTQFYASRAAELVSGGRLLVAQPGRNDERSTGEGLYDLLHDACMQLVRDGRLDLAAYRNVTMPIYFRSIEELLLPVDPANGPLRDQFAVERAETQEVIPPFAAEFAHSGDLAKYVEEYVGFAQAFTEPVLRAALDARHGVEIVPAIFREMKDLLRASPEKYVIRYLQTAVLLARR